MSDTLKPAQELNDNDIVHITHLKDPGQEVSAVKLYQLRDWAGWGFYADSQYTKQNPFEPPEKTWTRIPNNSLGPTLDKQEPRNTPLFEQNAVTGRTGDALIIGLRFTLSAKKNAWMDIGIDIGGAFGVIVPQTVQFVKNKNEHQSYSLTYLVYTLDTWEKNSGKFVCYPSEKDMKMSEISVSVTRTHAARERLGAPRTNGIV